LPNRFRLIALDIPICDGDRVHCIDILDALTKNFLGTPLDTTEMVDLKNSRPARVTFAAARHRRTSPEPVAARRVSDEDGRPEESTPFVNPTVGCWYYCLPGPRSPAQLQTEHQSINQSINFYLLKMSTRDTHKRLFNCEAGQQG